METTEHALWILPQNMLYEYYHRTCFMNIRGVINEENTLHYLVDIKRGLGGDFFNW